MIKYEIAQCVHASHDLRRGHTGISAQTPHKTIFLSESVAFQLLLPNKINHYYYIVINWPV